MTILYLYWH